MRHSLDITSTFYQPFCKFEDKKTDIEYILRTYYQERPDQGYDQPHKINQENPFFEQIARMFPLLKGLSKPQIIEASTIENDMDIGIFRHIRYLPALLHTHEFFEIVYVIDGHCINYIGNREFSMQPGDVCIIAPHTEHTISAFADDCIILNLLMRTSTFDKTFMNIFSDMDVISDFFIQTLYGKSHDFYLLFHTGNDTELNEIVQKILTEYHASHRYRRKIVNLQMSMFFMLLMQNHEQDVFIPNPRSSKSDSNFIYILHYLQANYLTTNLKALSAFFNYSERQMSRILRDYTGMNFSENIQKLRMERAIQFLDSTNLSIAEIAEESGYSNVTHFRQTFIKYYGVSPAQYRGLKEPTGSRAQYT